MTGDMSKKKCRRGRNDRLRASSPTRRGNIPRTRTDDYPTDHLTWGATLTGMSPCRPSARHAIARIALGALLIMLPGPQTAAAAEPAPPSADDIRAFLADSRPADVRMLAVRVGTSKHARRGLFIADGARPERIEVAFSFWIIAGQGRVVLVDTGFVNRAMIEKWRIEQYRDPVTALREAGFEPREVTDVVITHTHWDHIGGLSKFQGAQIWISKRAVPKLRGQGGGWLARLLRRAKRENRLHVTAGLHQVAPAIALVPVGLHAPGFQYVVVKRKDGLWVIASDVAPLRANFEKQTSTGQTSNETQTLQIQATMLDLAEGDLSRIVPGHDPAVYGSEAVDCVELGKRDSSEFKQ